MRNGHGTKIDCPHIASPNAQAVETNIYELNSKATQPPEAACSFFFSLFLPCARLRGDSNHLNEVMVKVIEISKRFNLQLLKKKTKDEWLLVFLTRDLSTFRELCYHDCLTADIFQSLCSSTLARSRGEPKMDLQAFVLA